MNKRALIYARVSYDDQARSGGRNLEGQIEDGRAYCAEKDYRIVAELAEDDRGASGYDWDLPMLGQSLDMARAGELDVFVTRELDRFARNLAKQLVVEAEFKRYGVDVEYILAEYDDTPEGRLNKHIRATIAEFEREKIAQRMTRGRRNVVKNGKVMLHGDKPPYGYRLEDGALVIYEPEARIIRMIYAWYVVDGLSLRAIAGRLTEMGVPTWADTHSNGFKKKRGEWIVASVDKILRKELYAGSWFYGKTNSKNGRNPREHWLSVEVPAIVSPEVWEKAQERRTHNREMSTRNTQHDYLVGRRVWCRCGAKMGSRLAGSRPYYYCRRAMGRLAEKNCDANLFRADHVDAAVWEWVKSWLSDPEALRHGLEKQQAEQERANKPLYNRLAVIDDLLSDNRRQLETGV